MPYVSRPERSQSSPMRSLQIPIYPTAVEKGVKVEFRRRLMRFGMHDIISFRSLKDQRLVRRLDESNLWHLSAEYSC